MQEAFLTRAVIQRVKSCSVSAGHKVISETSTGLLVLLGVAKGDTEKDLAYLSDKVLNMRIFPDDQGKMNLSVLDIEGQVAVVSQFTLLADTRKGRRPSFIDAEDPPRAEEMYEKFVDRIRAAGLEVGTGSFGEMMLVSLQNWGPVTIVIDSTA
ncbi:MAG TPA: D-aminoacyl-tRNA deacylase [Candidatus Anoxymicrobiaceae bacterium]